MRYFPPMAITLGVIVSLLSLKPPGVCAATLRVGPGQPYAVPSLAAAAVRDGDRVEIAAGTYAGDVAIWRADRLTLCGVGGPVTLAAQGQAAEGKGLWVIKGDDTTVEGLTFTGAAVPDHNGAGIRQEGRGLTVRRCVFHDNEDGILAGDSPRSDILVEDCEFDHNGQGDGYSHNLYINHVRRFTLRGCYSHNAHVGHDVKSRALATDILYCQIRDDDASDTSFLIDLPNGGLCRVIGNILRRGPNAQNATLVSFAEEGAGNPHQALSVVNNTFVSDRSRANFIKVAGQPTLRVVNNLFLGPGALPTGPPADVRHNRAAALSDFRDVTKGDYRLAPHSPARAAGVSPGLDIEGQDLTPHFEYAAPAVLAPRPAHNPPDLGAYAWTATTASSFTEPEAGPFSYGIIRLALTRPMPRFIHTMPFFPISIPFRTAVSGAALLLSLSTIVGAGPIKPKAAATVGIAQPADVTQALGRAGVNKGQLLDALNRVPSAQRPGLQFLIANMPDSDLQTLTAKFLLENIAIAYEARDGAAWKAALPPAVFLNDVLPYACLNEARDASRAMLRAKSLPLIAGATTPGEAAQMINRKLFPLVSVKYSTERHRPDQAPLETIASGKATCSGLSILLVDACRSVGIPARVAGTPLWSDNSGNHTWVEVWDGGTWHFIGAAEPDDKGLDHAWFEHNASLAKRDVPANAIYASSFAKTDLSFPLVWAPDLHSVAAVNVTDRYAAVTTTAATPAGQTRLLIDIRDADGKRTPAAVTVRDIADGSKTWSGTSKTETADMRDFLSFDVPQGRDYEIAATVAGRTVRQTFASGDSTQGKAVLRFTPVSPAKPLPAATAAKLKSAFAGYFASPADKQASWVFPAGLDASLLMNEPAVRFVAWEAYKAAPIHAAAKSDFDAKQVTFLTYLSPYTLKTVGTRPAAGWPLFIAMHGGGGASKEVNDEQWGEMQRYYKDHPEVGGYQYLALRAPNDTWNGFYDVYIYPLIDNLVRQFLLFGDVDPNKVFIMGYSHGGYGAFAIGPKEPDLFAAVHASASAPTDGETVAKTLRNTIFTNMVGELDTAYDRRSRDEKFAAEITALRGDHADLYPVTVAVMPGRHHSDLPDRDKIVDMYPAVRSAVPRDLSWLQSDDVIHDFFWLHTDAPAKTLEIDAICRDNVVTATLSPGVTSATVLLDSRLVDFSKPVTFDINGIKSTRKVVPSLRTLAQTLQRRGDPDLAFTAAVPLK